MRSREAEFERKLAQTGLWQLPDLLQTLPDETARLARLCYAASPVSDWLDTPPEVFFSCAAHARYLRENVSWTRALPEPLFLAYVLHPRVNNEALSDCRPVFHAALAERLRSLPEEAAILEINRWCAEHVAYQPTDERTRSALAVPFVGYTAFIMMSRNIKVIVLGVLLVIAAFVFLKFTSIGQGNALVRRARSAFNSEDPSFKVRLENQAKLREIMADKPFGAGLGHGGGKAKTFTPTAPLSQIPTDSWFVMIWVETGVVGILLHIGILLYILARGAYLVVFKLRNTQLRGFTAALTAGISGIVVMAYANEILGQIPTGAILYMSMGFIFLAPRFDRELSRKEILDKATAAQQPPLRENYE